MSKNTTYHEKGRAVLLTALMVLSVVAVSTAFAGAAAAGHNTATASVTVTPADDAQVDFAESDYIEERSNIAAIDVKLSSTDEAYVQFGDEKEVNYEVELHVKDGSEDGEVTILVDTTKMHDSDDAFSVADDGDTVSVEERTDLDDPIEAGDYTLTIATDAAFDNEQDTTVFTLTERSALNEDALQTYTAPDEGESLNDFENTTVTASSLIAQNDTLLATVETSSLFAYFQDDVNTIEDLNAGIDVLIEEQDPGLNTEPAVFNASNNDITVTVIGANQIEGVLILEIDYTNADNGEDVIEQNTDYNIRFVVSEDNEFAEKDESAEGEFVVEPRELEWDDSAAELPASEDAIALGNSNVAPGTEVMTRARAPGLFTIDDTVEVDGDRHFQAEFDFRVYEAGTEFTLMADVPEESDTIDSVLVVSEEKEDPEVGDNEKDDEVDKHDDEKVDEVDKHDDEKVDEPTDDDGTPGFGAPVAAVALLAAIILALRRQN